MIVAAGDGPCVYVAVGARRKGRKLVYPVDEVALEHGAGVETEMPTLAEGYARFQKPEFGPYRLGDLR